MTEAVNATEEGTPMIKPVRSLLDQLRDQSITLKAAVQLFMQEVYGDVFQFCHIPNRYQHCELGHVWMAEAELEVIPENELAELMMSPFIVNPRESHFKALMFFRALLKKDPLVCHNQSPFEPKIGLYLMGKPGTGKTHIMAAAGLALHNELWKTLKSFETKLGAAIESEIAKDKETFYRPTGDSRVRKVDISTPDKMKTILPVEERFNRLFEQFRTVLTTAPLQPTDVLYIGFDELYRLTREKPEITDKLMDAIATAQLIFIDDVHPKNDADRFALVHYIIERRYEGGRPGTFLTTNLSTTDLGDTARDKPSQLTARLQSRCQECFWTISFGEDCLDWRQVVRSRRVKAIDKAISAHVKNEITKQRENTGIKPPPP